MSNPSRVDEMKRSQPNSQELRRFTIQIAIAFVLLALLVFFVAITVQSTDAVLAAKRKSDIAECQRRFGDTPEQCAAFMDRRDTSRPFKADADEISRAIRSLDRSCKAQPEKC